MTNIEYKKMTDKQKYEHIQLLESKINYILNKVEEQLDFAKALRGSDGFLAGVRKIIDENKIS